jgi:lipopolysaccharide transport system ATP-binding protein
MVELLRGSRIGVEDFWALNGVTFNVQAGESLGIIGRNGAGKSTLLKVLSKITPPTNGSIVSRGRIASLLEVGTGFHPELTGRENIFFNGSLLGLRRKEIELLFDQIVDFSGVEKFLDTPLKHYSSGMQLRLAFSVAAFLEPEILIIDEVLAVGDSVFQQKCIQKMTEVSKSGRTILFVSHNFAALKLLCQRAVVLESGKLVFDGSVDRAIDFYNENSLVASSITDLWAVARTGYKRELIFSEARFNSNPISFGNSISLSIKLVSNTKREFREIDFGINFNDRNNNCIVHLSNRFLDIHLVHTNDDQVYTFHIDNILKPGHYRVTLFLRSEHEIQDYLLDVLLFEVLDGNPYKFADTQSIQGSILPNFKIVVS